MGAVGLSVEADELSTRDLSATHKSLVALMRLLGPGVIRLGGNSLDYAWWTAAAEPAPPWATSVVTPVGLSMLHDLLQVTGWRVILGVDLGHFDPARAASEALMAKRILGSQLLGFEIGNEPDHYGTRLVKLRASSYTVTNYRAELVAYIAAMRAVVPKIRFYGPDISSSSWLTAIVGDRGLSFAEITQHYYPTTYSIPSAVCKGTPLPTALELLSPGVRERENLALQTFVTTTGLAHRKVRISETNDTSSCDTSGGPATSPVFASALWALDWALRATSAGVTGLNFHGYFGRCAPGAFSPICATDAAAQARGEVIARPEYYGLMAARQLEGGYFVPVHVQGLGPVGSLAAYATRHAGGLLTLAVEDFAASGAASLLLKVPGYRTATVKRLLAPSISATEGVTFGHASVGPGGTFQPRTTNLPKTNGGFRVKLRPSSAIVVTLSR